MSDKLLIVDDDIETLRLVGLMLQRQGFEIAAANNGAQALSQAANEHPDLILLDVALPDMDGYEVTRILRKDPQTRTGAGRCGRILERTKRIGMTTTQTAGAGRASARPGPVRKFKWGKWMGYVFIAPG